MIKSEILVTTRRVWPVSSDKGKAPQGWPQDGCLCIYANSSGLSEYDTNLSLSRTGYQISRIKSSYKLFCVLIYNLPNFFQNSNFLPFLVRFLRYFCTYFDTDNDYYAVTIIKGNFDGSCKTSYNVLSHSHRDWVELCLSEVRVGGRGLVVDIRWGRGGDAEERGCFPFKFTTNFWTFRSGCKW